MKIHASSALYSMLVLISISIVTFFANKQVINSYNTELNDDIRNDLFELETLLVSEFEAFNDDLALLYNTPPISGLARAAQNNGIDPLDGTTTARLKDRLAQIFASLIQSNGSVFQLRVLNAQGHEIVRVDKAEGSVRRLTNSELQDKSKRFYFLQAKAMVDGQVFTSRIDLNEENNALSFPYTPTVRLARPIFSTTNEFFGVLVMNVDTTDLLNAIEQLVSNKYNIVLSDSDGFFIKHFDRGLEYSRDLAPDATLRTIYEQSQFLNSEMTQYSFNEKSWIGHSQTITVAQTPQGGLLTISLLLSEQQYQDGLFSRRIQSWLLLAGVLAVSLVAIYFLQRNNLKLTELLKKSEESEAAVDVAEDAIITTDASWQVNSINRAFEQLFSLRIGDVHKASLSHVLQQLGDTQFDVACNEMSRKLIFPEYDWLYEPANSDKKWLRIKVSKVRAEQSNAAYAVVVQDVTGEKIALDKVETVNRELESTVAERTEELERAIGKALEANDIKTNFISNVSHEMRTPLNGIVGATSLLKKETLNERQINLVKIAENSVDSLRAVINDVLDLSKIEAGKLELNFRFFEPESLLESVTSTMSVIAKDKNLTLYIDTNHLRFAQIYCDPHRLTQVLNNLLNNAIKFTEQGEIWVKVWSDIKPHVSYLHIEVKDTGVGIAADKVDSLFEPFVQAEDTTSAKYGGTGLGLSICKQILSLLGGEISVSSVLEKGSVFSLDIPVEDWREKHDNTTSLMAGKSAGLVIQNPGLLTLLHDMVKSFGGEALTLNGPFHSQMFTQCSALVVDYQHPDFALFKDRWNGLPSSVTQTIKLIVISDSSQPSFSLPDNSTNLITPLYRSIFASQLSGNTSIGRTTTIETKNAHSAESGMVSFKSHSVLIVDDNEINRQVAQFILEPLGVTLATARNGKEALDVLTKSPHTFDLIMMDCNMPVMDGYDTTKAIRRGDAGQGYQSIHIIAVTANAMKGESDKCYQVGMNDYVTKPIEPDILIGKITDQFNTNKALSPNTVVVDEHEETLSEAPSQQKNNQENDTLWDKESALSRLSGRHKLLDQLIQLFTNECDLKVQSLTTAFAAQDREQIRMDAHAFKGNCGDVGAAALYNTLAMLEDHAIEAEFDALETLFNQIKDQLFLTLKLFESHNAEQE
ncbi:ATP-binding protein [Alteromonas sp. P256]|uniref:ATP-binding protein n=1 Tax=Alteromonas sp. P256 TaxID=3117399 RepID=UPI002FE3BFBD